MAIGVRAVIAFIVALFLGGAALWSRDDFFMAAALSFAVVVVITPVILPVLHSLKFGQSIRAEGPKAHQAKSGTPTMGGIAIVIGATLGALFFAPHNVEVALALFITLGHFALGFLDDYIKVVKKRNLGLRSSQKLLGQIFIALVTIIVGQTMMGVDTSLWIPVVDTRIELGFLYHILVLLALVGASNAVNLTDGLDGLASGTVAVAMLAYAVIAYWLGQLALTVFAASVAFACLGFLSMNAHPAKIFMGDTGSLALGGAFAAMGILTHTELLLVVIGLVFVLEALSVIIQVISFQTTGQRVFRMSPIHHHFELGGWSEWKVVGVFWSVGIVVGIIGLLLAHGANI